MYKKKFDKEVEWFETKIAELLNSHAKIIKICAYSKEWFNQDVVEARLNWTKDKREFGKDPS